jgi:predicted metalloprotease
MLIVSLLELHLKQETMDIVSAKKSTDKQEKNTTDNSRTENVEENSSCQEFIEILGKNVSKYWKIGISWLTVLRNRLSSPFDEIAIEVLGNT